VRPALVTPLAGVWIEIAFAPLICLKAIVTPLAGVWIEILGEQPFYKKAATVTPLAGVWIEILHHPFRNILYARHSPCGSVD